MENPLCKWRFLGKSRIFIVHFPASHVLMKPRVSMDGPSPVHPQNSWMILPRKTGLSWRTPDRGERAWFPNPCSCGSGSWSPAKTEAGPWSASGRQGHGWLEDHRTQCDVIFSSAMFDYQDSRCAHPEAATGSMTVQKRKPLMNPPRGSVAAMVWV